MILLICTHIRATFLLLRLLVALSKRQHRQTAARRRAPSSWPHFSHLFCILQALQGRVGGGARVIKKKWQGAKELALVWAWQADECWGSAQKKAHTKWRNVADFTHGKQKTTRAYTNNKKMHSGLVSVDGDDDGAAEVLRWSFFLAVGTFLCSSRMCGCENFLRSALGKCCADRSLVALRLTAPASKAGIPGLIIECPARERRISGKGGRIEYGLY